ncbi:DUF5977 domain-containing protein [Chitinophaga nivalis]|uniref:DUF5977 domain-containing protein n=1 Tax=Chitinophaga nivalis TaxID=2991709 RepID=A0ABT3IM46_9BACT|nr:DUF5977 domain-containing protein [Chitinophaga nivalis]MCW3465272.1 DUF5977 domain-containing protein [Chitinophaga nivalis]MCW3485036.1 DUF5977 domain-containing protein [Chitinophaga nivalis]
MFSSGMKRCLLIVFILLNIIVVKAQRRSPFSEVSIASPTAASLGKFVDMPVSYHTGSPQINIPIYEIESGPLKLPISLSYHPSGLKVIEPAGWAGAGWTLNAGGVITRTVMGAPDEKGTGTIDSEFGHFSEFGYNSYLYTADIQDWAAFAEGRKDGEPDLFFFNFNGYSGKFYFSDDRLPILVPEQDLKIEYSYSGTGSISSFIITTPDGTRYFFGATPSAIDTDPVEITNPMTIENGYGYSTTVSSWYLNKIESNDKVFTINLSYLPESYSYFSWSTFPISSYDVLNNKKEYGLVKIFQSGVKLDKITFSNGHMDFIAGETRTDLGGLLREFTDDVNTNAKTLGAINISNDRNFCKRWQFFYTYFEDNQTGLPGSSININTDRKRLKLDSLQELSCSASITLPPYKFDYYVEKVSRRLTFGIDHWGFYNGATSNQRLIPTYKVDNQIVPAADRNAAWPAMRGGALRSISYPTGGNTDFEFEAHRANISYTRDSYVNDTYLSIGYDGSNPLTVSKVVTLPAGMYSATLSSSNQGSNANLSVQDANGNAAFAMIAYSDASGPSIVYKTAYLAAGTYTIYLSKDCSNPSGVMTGVGANASVYQRIPISYTVDTIVGGLRIKQVTTREPVSGKDMITAYSYKAGNVSSAVVYSRPIYVQTVRNDLIRDLGYWNPATGYERSCSPQGCVACGGYPYYVSPNSLRPMATTQGTHLGYSEVKVTRTGNGYSVYRYYTGVPLGSPPNDVAVLEVNTNDCNNSIGNFPPAPLPFVDLRGELSGENHFREDNELLNERFYNYSFSAPVATTPAFIATYFKNYTTTMILGTNYKLSTTKKIQSIVTENNYDPASDSYQSTITTNDFQSPNHHEATNTTTTNSLGEELVVKSKYAFDFRTNCDAVTDCTPSYKITCDNCYTTYRSDIANCDPAVPYCITSVFLKYQKCLAQARASYVSCRRTNFTDPVNAYSTCLQTTINNAGPELKPILSLQRNYENAAVEISSWKNGKLLKSAFTRYDFASNPAGQVVPDKYQLINLTAPSTAFTAAGTSGTGITKDTRYKDEKSNEYSNGSVVQSLGRDGIPKSYLYDYQNVLPIAIATNASIDQIAYTSFEADGRGGWNFSGSYVNDNTAPTGTRCYNLSSGALSKSGLTTSVTYIVSYWTKNTSALTVAGTQGSPVKGRTTNGWTYFEHKVTGVTTLAISGAAQIDEVKLYPNDAQMRTFTHAPLIGISSESDFKDQVTYYVYDDLGRLSLIKDMNGNIRKMICYNNSGQPEDCGGVLFSNAALSREYTRNNCGVGFIGSKVIYAVQKGKYTAATQATADALAKADTSTQGQNYANAKGTCSKSFPNAATSKSFTRNNCGENYDGSSVLYEVPEGKYRAATQLEADNLAKADMEANGPNYANQHGSCYCNKEGYKEISGRCEKGERIDGVEEVGGGRCRNFHMYKFSDGSTSGKYYGSDAVCP